ncbi:hypothetical protein D3C75_442320 [compost metagenome]
MTKTLLDSFTSNTLDGDKWQVQQFSLEDGSIWRYEDPLAQVSAIGGELEIRVEGFQLQHDTVPMFDNPKHLVMLREPIPLDSHGVTSISCEMACENHNGNSDDLLDGFSALVIGDFANGLIFDFIISATRVGVVYERLPLPGVTPPGGEWLQVIQSPLVARNAPGEFHHYEIRFDRRVGSCEWLADGRRVYYVAELPLEVQSVVPGIGLFTLKQQSPEHGSVSNHGQGATGRWRNLQVIYS